MAKKTTTAMQQTSEDECQWESGALGLSKEHAEKMTVAKEAEVDDALDLQLISIRLPKILIKELKYIAGREGLGYQPLMRRVLQRFTAAEYKAIAHEQFMTSVKAAEAEPDPEVVEEPARKRA